MFKVVLLALSVSVVWPAVYTTYVFDDNVGLELLDSIRLDEYHRPIFHSNSPIHFDYNSHDISFPHLAAEGIQYINQPIHHLHNLRESGFSIPNIEHENAKQHNFQPKNEHYSQHHENAKQYNVQPKNEHYSQHNENAKQYNVQPKNEHYSQHHENHKHNQQELGLKVPNSGYFLHQKNKKAFYENSQNDRHFLHPIFKHSFNAENAYDHNNGQFQSYTQNNQNKGDGKSPQTNNYDINQQKIIDTEYSKPSQQKIEQKTNSDDYGKEEQKSISTDYNDQQEQKPYSQEKDQNSHNNYNISNYDFQHNGNFHPALYTQSPLTHAHYIKLHEGNGDSYSELPSNLGQIRPIYKDIDIIRYQSGLSSDEGIKIHSHTPILINHNIHANLANHAEYLIAIKNNGGYEDIPDLQGYAPFYLLQNNGSQPDINSFPKYPDKEAYNSNGNLEQQSLSEEHKPEKQKGNEYIKEGDSLTEYKGTDSIKIPEDYTKNAKVEISYHSEQKTLEVGYKSQSTGQKDSYGSVLGNEDKYSDGKSLNAPKYSDSSSKDSEYSTEQKSLEEKRNSPKVDYANNGHYEKGSAADSQQKSVDVDFKSSPDKYDYKPKEDIGPDYIEQSNTGETKYPDKHLKDLEQKSVETETYKETKATFKSSGSTKDATDSSHKIYSDHIRSAITDLKKNIDSKISNYETPSYIPDKKHSHPNGGYSTSYFNSHHSPNLKDDYGKKSDYLPHSNNGYDAKPKFTGNTYGDRRTGFPKYPTSFSNNFNHFPTSSYISPHAATSGPRYNRPYVSNIPLTTRNHGYSHHKVPYSRTHKPPIHSGISGYPSKASIPTYHQTPYSGKSTPLHYLKSEPYNNEKFVKITYEHPQHSLKKDVPIYISSTKPNNDYKKTSGNSNTYPPFRNHQSSLADNPSLKSYSHSNHNSYVPVKKESGYKSGDKSPPVIHSSYPDRDAKDLGSHGTDYSSDIGSIEYPGIGEKSSTPIPKYESKEYSEPHIMKHTKTEQKSYENDELLPTYTETTSNVNKPSKDEQYGIGEVGTISSGKSEIVGGRYPIKRPAKSSPKTKYTPSRKETKSDDKTEQKYLPITATLSDKKPDPKQYGGSIKTKTPEKTEQEELAYEALLGGHGPQNHATGTSGYGFNAPAPPKPPSYPHASAENDHEHSAPMPYEFHYDIQDDEHGSEQYRREKMDDNGYLTGSYGFKDSEGIFREVEYEASKHGFKVNSIKTNEPGTDNEDPADVHIEVQKHR